MLEAVLNPLLHRVGCADDGEVRGLEELGSERGQGDRSEGATFTLREQTCKENADREEKRGRVPVLTIEPAR